MTTGTLWLTVALAGLVGCSLRFAMVLLFQQAQGQVQGWLGWSMSAWAVLSVNVVGCLLAGFLMRWVSQGQVTPMVQTTLQVGFLGGLTTFSSLVTEYTVLAQQYGYGHPVSLLYPVLNIVLGAWLYGYITQMG
ncbi:MAG: FluC/FEX family fluoride channel [Vampirovibrionales bacterium]